jgi:hypothetical protein
VGVTKKRATKDPIFARRWVHLFEEDTPDGQVYRPEDDTVPLSRRPRERFELDPDGAARLYVAGPDDRFLEQSATWTHERGVVVIRSGKSGTELRVVDRSAKRLLVQVRTGPP